MRRRINQAHGQWSELCQSNATLYIDVDVKIAPEVQIEANVT